MKILKHGDPQSRKFTCAICGCEFVAELKDYEFLNYPENRISVCCPECGRNNIIKESNAPLYPLYDKPEACDICGSIDTCTNCIESGAKYNIVCMYFDEFKRWRIKHNESEITD